VRAERRVRLEAAVAEGARAREEVLLVGCDDAAEGDLACTRKGVRLCRRKLVAASPSGAAAPPLGSAAPPGAALRGRVEEGDGGQGGGLCTVPLPRRDV